VVRNLPQRSLAASIVQFLESVEAVARVTHHATGLADVAELPGQLKYADLGTNYLLLLSHGALLAVRGAHYRYGLRPSRRCAPA
jgi:hypothetical protein